MADLSLDELLSSSLKSAAEPAPSAGVADLIRSRVAAGETGTSVAGSTAPGWGGTASGLVTIVAPVALIVVAGAVGGALGASGAFGTGQDAPPADIPAYLLTIDTAGGALCPGDPASRELPAGTRVYAVARTDDSAYLAIRDTGDPGTLLWFAADDVRLDAGSPDPASLPVSGCDEPEVTFPTPTPVYTPPVTTPPDDGGNNPPPPPKDSVAPVVTSIKASKSIVLNNEASVISVQATDNVGVTRIVLSWSNGSVTGSTTITGSSGSYSWSNNSTANNSYGNYTFTARAYDAAGNASAPASTVVNRQYFG